MDTLLLGTFKIVSAKTIRNVFVKLVPRNGTCVYHVFCMNERWILD